MGSSRNPLIRLLIDYAKLRSSNLSLRFIENNVLMRLIITIYEIYNSDNNTEKNNWQTNEHRT